MEIIEDIAQSLCSSWTISFVGFGLKGAKDVCLDHK